jgi:hypothetical protein
MSIDLSGRGTVGVAVAIRVDIPDLEVIRLSTWHRPLAIQEQDGNVYTYGGAGILLSVGETTQELRATSNETSVGLSGIPITYAITVQQQRLKGSLITIYRVFTDPVTDEPLTIAGNPVIMFKGAVSNYNFSEQFNEFSRDASLSINLICSSIIDVLQTKIAGRRTNKDDMRFYYPTDPSFDRVTVISNRPFDFGVDPKVKGQTAGSNRTTTQTQASDAVVQDDTFNNNDSGG